MPAMPPMPNTKPQAQAGVASVPSADEIQAAVTAGMRDAFRDPAFAEGVGLAVREQFADSAFWGEVSQAMQSQARQAAGGWLLGGLAALLRKLLLVAVAVAAVYMLSGVPGVVALLKSQSTGG